MLRLIGIVNGEKIYCRTEDPRSVDNALAKLESMTGCRWGSFNEETGNKNLVFYKRGMFTQEDIGIKVLRFNSDQTVELPLNCSSTAYMFHEYNIPEGFSLGDDFDTSKIIDMEGMFKGATIPEGFRLGNRFDTSNVLNMNGMFEDTSLPKGFSLGDKFDTSNVLDMCGMFRCSEISEGFNLGGKFNTSNVICMRSMFEECKIPVGFSLGNTFHTSNVEDMCKMFSHTKFSPDFYLPENFAEQSIKESRDLFFGAGVPDIGLWFESGQDQKTLKWFKDRAPKSFNKEEYLREYMSLLPSASVEACQTKEDCDALLQRLGVF